MNWNDPSERAALIDRVGPDQYLRMFGEHRKKSIIETVNGHDIRPVNSRFGRLMHVGDTGRAFSTIEQARKYALATEGGK